MLPLRRRSSKSLKPLPQFPGKTKLCSIASWLSANNKRPEITLFIVSEKLPLVKRIMEESHRKFLQKLRLKISRNINVRRITEELFSGGILDENDREEILAETTTQYKSLHLVDLLPRRGSQAFPVFLQALHGSGADFLVNDIQLELSGMIERTFLIYVDQVHVNADDFSTTLRTRYGNVLIIRRLPVIKKVTKTPTLAYYIHWVWC